MTLEELIKVKESLEELVADIQIDFGPAYEMAKLRQKEALQIVRKEIKFLQNKQVERAEANERRAEMREIRSKLGYSRIGRNNV